MALGAGSRKLLRTKISTLRWPKHDVAEWDNARRHSQRKTMAVRNNQKVTRELAALTALELRGDMGTRRAYCVVVCDDYETIDLLGR